MEIKTFNTKKALGEEVLGEIEKIVHLKKDAVLCLAAGHTSLELFRLMVEAYNGKQIDFSQCLFVGLDEWVGLGRGDDGSCIDFVYKNLFGPLNIQEEKIIFYDGKSDLAKECAKIDQRIKEIGGIDFMLLGIGMNGHLGLNEPGTSFDKYSHVVVLDNTTKEVGQKYFCEKSLITKGITMGMRNLDSCKRIVLIATGEHKKTIVNKLVHSPITNDLPATYLKRLPQSILFTDLDI